MAEFATLEDVKKHLNMTSTANDDELGLMLDAAEDVVRSLVGSFAAVEVTEPVAVHGGTAILSRRPVVGDVVLSDESLTGFTVDREAGLLRNVGYTASVGWAYWGTTQLTATYSTGGGVAPAAVELATLIIVGHLWETQRGTSPSALTLQGEDAGPTFGAGYAIPNRAKDLLAPYLRSGQIA